LHYASNSKQSTHTRIGDKELNIRGGSFRIESDVQEFMDCYFNKVFEQGELEYMTEKQLVENGAMLIDVDLQYATTVTDRQHNESYILDLIGVYLEKIAMYVDVIPKITMNIFVMEKQKVNMLNDKTKDGIHIIFGLQLHKAIQVMIRNDVLKIISDIWEDLPIINTWDQVLDEGVTKGCVNWQMYGSRKPAHEAYLVSTMYTTTYNGTEWDMPTIKTGLFDTKKYINQLSARYTDHPKSTIKDTFKDKFDTAVDRLTRRGKQSMNIVPKESVNTDMILLSGRFDRIKDEPMLDELIACLHEQTNNIAYRVKETHAFTLALPNDYYGPGSFSKWIRVGWALANTSPKMFITWLKMSCQDGCRGTLGANGKFDWKTGVLEMYELWKTFDCNNPDGLSYRSIMYWCKKDSFEQYNVIRKNTIDYFIDQTIRDRTEFDLASVLFNIFKDKFVCVSITKNLWYEYRNHRWFEIDAGNTLRLCISCEMHHEYLIRIHELTTLMQTMEQSDTKYEAMRKKTSILASIAVDLKKTVWKNNIMREARELCYDRNFRNKLDQNPYLLCFNNGVIDFKQQILRPGQPDDYISKCTNIEYIKRTTKAHSVISGEIIKFISELFPDEQLRKYMWEHLASAMIGTLENQTFNIYTGSGRNGKSCLVDLMAKVLGEYKGTVPITLITQKRITIGSSSSEVVQLMGTRYAVMQEPSKGDKINEGVMKEITGGDVLQGRALFKDTVTFTPQFKLVVCTNTLFSITSNDDGTWRRIRVCDFVSKFLDHPFEDDNFPKDQYPFQFQLDKKLNERFEAWAPIFASMLVEKAYSTLGNVTDCDIVLASSNDYRDGQDYLREFVRDKIVRTDGEKIKKTELLHTFREWYQMNHGRAVPKAKELYEYIDKIYGRYKNGCWINIKLLYDEEEEETL